ncbi:redox-regulated ATPase YchF [Candidatus Pacearchaeota archaeon]|nr:redox-regulated ATPase YchF [Candidatus Pacearchaeota archaeon]
MLIGIIGKPSSGKSTFFKACTLADVAIASYPFTTIEPNQGIGYVRIPCIDSYFKVQCAPREGFCRNHERFVPVKLIDVAGLVPEAHKGKGKGNQFLDDLREADILIHVVDASGTTDFNGNPAKGHDPCQDIEFLEQEIVMWLFGILEKNWNSISRKSQTAGKPLSYEIAQQLSGLKINDDNVKDVMKRLELSEKVSHWNDNHILEFVKEIRKISKPIIIAANKADLPESYENIEHMKEQFPELAIIPCSGDSELALREAVNHSLIDYLPGNNNFHVTGKPNEKQKRALNFIKENVLKTYSSTGIQQVLNSAVFDFLHYVAVFPAGTNKLADSKGNILPDCYLIPPNTTALDFAFKLHTDLGKNFVKAINIKTKKPVGKDYILQNLDAIEIVTR